MTRLLRLLDLDDEIRPTENGSRIRNYLCPGGPVVDVLQIDRLTGAGLDYDLVPVSHQFANGARCQPNTELVVLDFTGYADKHLDLSGRSDCLV